MNRRRFIEKSCVACFSITAMANVLTGCQVTHYISGVLGKEGISVKPDDFKTDKINASYRSFIIIRNDALQYPICLFRKSNTVYTAIWMRCSHQGAELQVSGDTMSCPAHGSEFNNNGLVTNGPADRNLRNFPVTLFENEIYIDLRKA